MTGYWLEEFEKEHCAVIDILFVIFPICGLLSSGLLLMLFIFQRSLRKYSSLMLNMTLLHLFLRSISVLIFKSPQNIQSDIGDSSPIYCSIMKLVPEYWKIVLIIGLPLHSMERLIRFKTRSFMTLSKRRQLFGCLLIVTHTLSLFIVILPTTSIFNENFNVMCDHAVVYGESYVYIFMSINGLSITLTAALVGVILIKLNFKRLELRNDQSRRTRLSQVVRAEVMLTLAISVGLMPCGIINILKLMCGSYMINHNSFCDSKEEGYRMHNILQMLRFTHKIFCYFSPIVYLLLNSKLRHKVWLSFRNSKSGKKGSRSQGSQGSNLVSEDTSSESLDSSSTRFTVSIITSRRGNSLSKTISVSSLDEDDILTIANDLQVIPGKKLTPPPIWQREKKDSHMRQRSSKSSKSLTDLVDVMSVISEKSEVSRTSSITRLSVSQLESRISPVDSGRGSLRKSDSSDNEEDKEYY